MEFLGDADCDFYISCTLSNLWSDISQEEERVFRSRDCIGGIRELFLKVEKRDNGTRIRVKDFE